MKTLLTILQILIAIFATLVVSGLLFKGQIIFALVIFSIVCLHLLIVQTSKDH